MDSPNLEQIHVQPKLEPMDSSNLEQMYVQPELEAMDPSYLEQIHVQPPPQLDRRPKLESMDPSYLELIHVQPPPQLNSPPLPRVAVASRGRSSKRGGRAGSAEGDSSSGGDDAPAAYTGAETEVLARCWADDSVVAGAQNKDSYWGRILKKYHANRPDKTPKRNAQKLRNHWFRVKNLLADFQQLYKECEMQHRSGESEAGMLARVLSEWQNRKGAPFKHLETWRIVKDTPKFAKVFSDKYPMQTPAKRTKTGEDGSYTASDSESTPSMGTPQSANESSSRLERPMGRDAAEAIATWRKKVDSSDIASRLDEATAMMQKATDSFNMAIGYGIIMKNTSNMSPEKKAIHEAFVAELKKKIGWNF